MSGRYVVIMAGGRGERFWPLSRLARPKQLQPIVGDKPLLAQTLDRLEGFVPTENILILTNAEQREAVLEVCPQLLPENVIGEPVGRDTAPAVGLAWLLVKRRDPEATFAMLPADHVVHDAAGFRRSLEAAFISAEEAEVLVTLGISPTEPATGYGYIERAAALPAVEGCERFQVARFVEKPDLTTAQAYLASGHYSWNAGMFIWRVSVVGKAFAESAPELAAGLQTLDEGLNAGQDLADVLATHYGSMPKISIDYAVMEKATNVVTVAATFDWDDVGEWPALARHEPKDAAENVLRGAAFAHDAKGNIVLSEPGHLVAVVGVEDMIVVHTGDATLVCPRSKAQDLKKAVRALGENPDWQGVL